MVQPSLNQRRALDTDHGVSGHIVHNVTRPPASANTRCGKAKRRTGSKSNRSMRRSRAALAREHVHTLAPAPRRDTYITAKVKSTSSNNFSTAALPPGDQSWRQHRRLHHAPPGVPGVSAADLQLDIRQAVPIEAKPTVYHGCAARSKPIFACRSQHCK
jgi:hypothetical protein